MLRRIRITEDVAFAPQGCGPGDADGHGLSPLWAIEHTIEAAKQDTGLATSEVCSTVGRYRYVNAGTVGLGATGRGTGGGSDTLPNLCQVELRQQVPVLVWSRPP